MMDISVVILTKNNERTIQKTLESTNDFSEVILLDSGSTDQTLEIAKNQKNVKIIHCHFTNFGKMRNQGASFATHDWILALDSDEVISSELIDELQKENLLPDTAYEIPFINFYNNRKIKWCGWYPESHIRLYHRKKNRFQESFVHEKLSVSEEKIKKLHYVIYHFSYLSISDFLQKMELYSSLFAKEYHGKKKSSFFKALYHGWGAFFKSYILKRGFLGGKEGFIISTYQANTAFYKYLKLLEVSKKDF